LGGSAWYSFAVTNGTTYYVWNDDGYQHSELYNNDSKFVVYDGNGMQLGSGDDCYNSPVLFTAESSGTAYIKVMPYEDSDSCTFAIKWSTFDGDGGDGGDTSSFEGTWTASWGDSYTFTGNEWVLLNDKKGTFTYNEDEKTITLTQTHYW
jgi:hypothetical protein